MIRNCRIWLLGVVVVVLAAGTTVMMAARAQSRGDADSLLSVLLASPAPPTGQREARRYAQAGDVLVSSSEVALQKQKAMR
jgi:hypothetical protein